MTLGVNGLDEELVELGTVEVTMTGAAVMIPLGIAVVEVEAVIRNSSVKSIEEVEDDKSGDEVVDNRSGDEVVDNGSGDGSGNGSGVGSGVGSGDGSGNGSGDGSGVGSGNGSGVGSGVGSGNGSGDGDGEVSAETQRGVVPELKSHRLLEGQQTLGKSRHGRRSTWPPQAGCQGSLSALNYAALARGNVSQTDLIAPRCPTTIDGTALAVYAKGSLQDIATLSAATCART